MQVFIFLSQKDADVVGFTGQRYGSNLPAEFAPWNPLDNSAMQLGTPLAGITDGSNAVLQGIQQDGFYLARSGVRVTRSTSPRFPQ